MQFSDIPVKYSTKVEDKRLRPPARKASASQVSPLETALTLIISLFFTMAISKAKKGEIVEKLTKALKGAKSLVFVNFHGLKVSDATQLRRALKAEGVSYAVTKKTLTKRVLEAEKFSGTQPELTGELAMAWGEDLIAPAREVYSFQKKFPEGLKILGGVFEGKYLSKMEMEGIATIPSPQVLRGMFVNIINSPIQRFVISLNQIAEKKA